MSEPIFLNKSRFYKMIVFMYERGNRDHVSVGMRKPSGEYERPIPGTRLFWTLPGKIKVFLFNNRTGIYQYFQSDKKTSAVLNLAIHTKSLHEMVPRGSLQFR